MLKYNKIVKDLLPFVNNFLMSEDSRKCDIMQKIDKLNDNIMANNQSSFFAYNLRSSFISAGMYFLL